MKRFDIFFEHVMNLLLESRKNDYIISLKSKNIDEHIADELIEMNNPKKERIALYWILKGTLDFPKEKDKLEQAFNLIEKQHLDYQKFDSPESIINRDDKSTQKIVQSFTWKPDTEPTFSNKKSLGNGIDVYVVEDSKRGQIAVRHALDIFWGFQKNCWCLAARHNGKLDYAWYHWAEENIAYPKRIAFKDGKLLAFSAGKSKQIVEWWDNFDESYKNAEDILGVKDDREFLNKYGKINLLKFWNLTDDEINELLDDVLDEVNEATREYLIEGNNVPYAIIDRMIDDGDYRVRMKIAEKPNLPLEFIKKLANDESYQVRMIIAERTDLTDEIIRILENDYDDVKAAVANRLIR